jgi:hypothetical protein
VTDEIEKKREKRKEKWSTYVRDEQKWSVAVVRWQCSVAWLLSPFLQKGKNAAKWF